MDTEPGRPATSDDSSNDVEQGGNRTSPRFVPRSPLDEPPLRGAPGQDEANEEEASPPGDDPETEALPEVISLPANSDELAEPERASAAESVSAAESAGSVSSAAHWLNRFRSSTRESPEAPVSSAEMEAEPDDEEETSVPGGSDEVPAFGQARPEEVPDGTAETLTCPVCGQRTNALRFCGYCGAPLGAARDAAESQSRVDDLMRRARTWIDPSRSVVSTLPQAIALMIGAALILIALLADSAGSALIVGCAIVPILILLTLNQHDVFEEEPPLLLLGVGLAGGIAGIVVGGLGAWILSGSWFSTGVLNYGAGGFGGRFAEAEGASPFVVWFINGLLLPLAGLAGILAAPIALRRLDQFRNEAMDGLILAGSAGAGFAIGSAIVFWAPIFNHGGPSIGVSDWTLMLIGMGILRPVVLTLAGAMLGAGVWRYMMTSKQRVLILPAIGSIGGVILLYLGSIWIQPSGGGLWPEVLWVALIAVAVFILYRLVLMAAITDDRKALGSDGTRVVCPHCHRLTLKGAFCSRCGKPLPQGGQGDTSPASADPSETDTAPITYTTARTD